MAKTIQIDEKTMLLLKKIKDASNASSYDEVIAKSAINYMQPRKTMAGSLKGLSIGKLIIIGILVLLAITLIGLFLEF